jgi:hypothetical protein
VSVAAASAGSAAAAGQAEWARGAALAGVGCSVCQSESSVLGRAARCVRPERAAARSSGSSASDGSGRARGRALCGAARSATGDGMGAEKGTAQRAYGRRRAGGVAASASRRVALARKRAESMHRSPLTLLRLLLRQRHAGHAAPVALAEAAAPCSCSPLSDTPGADADAGHAPLTPDSLSSLGAGAAQRVRYTRPRLLAGVAARQPSPFRRAQPRAGATSAPGAAGASGAGAAAAAGQIERAAGVMRRRSSWRLGRDA